MGCQGIFSILYERLMLKRQSNIYQLFPWLKWDCPYTVSKYSPLYNVDWAQIYTRSAELMQVCRDLSVKEVITVHHSKYTLSKHPWDEPRRNEDALEKEGILVRCLVMGKPEKLVFFPN